ncbi:3'-5' exoribonuclease HELZ2 isoform 2-T2 [Pelodytes ibericus]
MGQFTTQSSPNLTKLQEEVELQVACTTCSRWKYENTYIHHPLEHSCDGRLLLGRLRNGKTGELWREVRQRPIFPIPARYAVCFHYQPKKGCIKHHQNCTFAWSEEERLVWAFEKTSNLDRNQLSSLLLCKPPAASKAPSSWANIQQKFSGHFQEVCEQCFFQSPPKITSCIECHTHPRPVPLLVHLVSNNARKQCHAIRPMPRLQPIRLCGQLSHGLLCRLEDGHCPHAHSEVELAVWMAERDSQLSRGQFKQQPGLDMGFYCRLCLVTAPTQESFEVHCSSLEHRHMMADDMLTMWNHRAPPIDINHLTLCESPLQCAYGNGCPKAHSKEELEEWLQRKKVRKRNKQVVEAEGLHSYQDRVMQEYQLNHFQLAEEIEGVKISCDIPLMVHVLKKPARSTWTFTVHSKMNLLHVALLKMDPGASFSLLAPGQKKACPYAQGSSFQINGVRPNRFEVRVSVEGSIFGLFEQWLVLDFGIRPILLQKIFLQVGGQSNVALLQVSTSHQEKGPLSSSERWHSGNKLCIPCLERTLEEKQLLECYKPPAMNQNYRRSPKDKQSLTTQNYRKSMHERLLQEEAAREQVISRLNMKVSVTLSETVTSSQGMKVAPKGELFATVPLPKGMTQDTEEGYLLHWSVNSALLAPYPLQGDKVYEVSVDTSAGLESSVLLKISERCCRELALENNTAHQMGIQFQLDRWHFCVQHEAVDRLLNEKLVLPELTKCYLPTSQQTMSWGNSKQQLAASYIVGSVPERKPVAPLLIYGPFGTGKTYTMANTALEVIKQTGMRVLICTHNNSVADLYIREHFHPHVLSGYPEATPLRVKYIKSPLNRTDATTLQYCAVKEDHSTFFTPPRAYLDRFRIIVTTAVTSRDLDVPRGYFSHIFLDETAQMLESEALIPLSLADHWTRIILTGDHMQETPRLFCQGIADWCEEPTLLTRLFSHYQKEDCPVAKGARIVFHQNYRSVPIIISFVSRCFYVGRGDAIEACGKNAVAPPAGRYALGLCHVHGLCTNEGSSWVNQSEVLQVLEEVKLVLDQWPKSWGPVQRSSICVMSQGSQIQLIRQELRKIKYSEVTVTSYDNIIGCEFRVIILSTVRSLESLPSTLPESSNFSLQVFCDPRVLNTILTRARSQIIVVGDMVALCSFGGCSRIWRRYIQECVNNGSASPPDLTVEGIKQVVNSLQVCSEQQEMEEDVEDSDSWTSDLDINSDDSILQELLDSKTEAIVTVSEEGMLEVSSEASARLRKDGYTDFPFHILEQYLQLQPNTFKKCKLFKDTFESGYALTLDDKSPKQIKIKGRMNCGMGFSGDEVVVHLLPDTNHQEGHVVGVLKAGEGDRKFVCFMDSHDSNILIPVDRSITKIFCPRHPSKLGFVKTGSFQDGYIKTHGFVKLTQELKRDHLFLVQVIIWRQGFYYPLGIVNRILPKIHTVEMGLKALDLEYRVTSTNHYPEKASEEVQNLSSQTPHEEGRLDCRNIITFTIDPKNAKDLDDAISVRDLEDHYEIGVHITDVASMVSPGSELDKEAKARGVTFYRPNCDAVHMLPLKLSSDLCSLKPQCDRRALSLFVQVEKRTDQMVKFDFHRTLIRSDLQLSYEEANSILSTHNGHPLMFSSIEDCLRVAWYFSKVHCRCRLQEAAMYKQPDEHCPVGARNAQRMIEELMIMYNNLVAEYLCEQEPLNHLVPVRCQAQPSLEKLESLRNKVNHLLPVSTYLSHHLSDIPDQRYPSSELQLTMLTSVWKQLQDAAQKEDYITVIDLLSTDDLHPMLCCAARDFRKHLGRASFQRTSMSASTGHYSLHLCSYTWASSPIRRYIDIVLQRLLQSTLVSKSFQMTTQEIDLLCYDFDKMVQRETSYEKKGFALQLALALHNEVQQKLAVVISADPNNKSCQVVFPLNGDCLSNPMLLDYSLLQPVQQPEGIPGGTRLSWRRRMYSYFSFRTLPYMNMSQQGITVFNATAWHDALKSLSSGNPEEVFFILKKGIESLDTQNFAQQSSCGHYMELTLDLHPGDSMLVQLCSTADRGFPTPSPQLCSPATFIQLCLEHTRHPVDCFARLAHRAPLKHYKNAADYELVWQPLCAMEAVVSAISEGGGVLLTDVPIRWKNNNTDQEAVGLKGSFKVLPELIKECDLDMKFTHCYLCVRMENLRANSSSTLMDSQTFTWVAHGLTEKNNEVTKEDGGKVEFHIHQATMHHVPKEAFDKKARFTVEIIQKLLPDIRKEMAVVMLKSASELAKNIALGQRVPDIGVNIKFKSQDSFNIPEFPRGLNRSQTKAVKTALTQSLTLIQGPPGTGKTVVGVHIVHWFHQINIDLEPQMEEEINEQDERGTGSDRRVLMYCGPSNKSVDVVAEMLLPLRAKLRPLRVYSEQMELSEFQYPGSSLRMSGYLREGKPHPALRSITLHHLIRQPTNSYHEQILAMDRRIQNQEEIAQEELEGYKKTVNNARKEELAHHNIILCTCVTASSKLLTELHVSQLVVDECAMCTEPEVLVPLVSHKHVESVVLLGDHRQLRPVILNDICRLLKMDCSLFERYQERALMLDTQYRMHNAICAFPSQEFYEGRLHTSEQLRLQPSLFSHSRSRCCPVVFGEVEGQEQSLNVTSEEGNINSKANQVESVQVVRIAILLVRASVRQEDIAILTPYNAQVSLITTMLKEQGLNGITICTIMKSQGSEWRYVIFSTVRAMPLKELDSRPTKSWIRQHLGFLGDPNQINVALTRAKEGLCVLGNPNLLQCSLLWRRLLEHYRGNVAVDHASRIQVDRPHHR